MAFLNFSQRVGLETPTGTYTPVATDFVNSNVITVYPAMWSELNDNQIKVSGSVLVEIPINGDCQFYLTLPVASNFTDTLELSGVITELTQSAHTGVCQASASNDQALLTINSISDEGYQLTIFYQYTYTILP